MKHLTTKEEELMNILWEKGPMTVREIQTCFSKPQPHVNTISTQVRILEEKGFLTHKELGRRCFQYVPVQTRDVFKSGTLKNIIHRYFDHSFMSAVSTLVKEEEISLDELKELIRQVEQGSR